MARRSAFEIWNDTFNPVTNHLATNRNFDNCMFETFGPEIEFVKETVKSAPETVWTIVEGDSGKWYISQGCHHVNRIGYLITKQPYDSENKEHVKRFGQRDVFYM